MAGKDEAHGFAIDSVLGKWLDQNSVVNAIVNRHGEFYDKLKSFSEISLLYEIIVCFSFNAT